MSFCSPIVNVKDIKGVVVLRAEERALLPLLFIFEEKGSLAIKKNGLPQIIFFFMFPLVLWILFP